jgi:hypothetical protein
MSRVAVQAPVAPAFSELDQVVTDADPDHEHFGITRQDQDKIVRAILAHLILNGYREVPVVPSLDELRGILVDADIEWNNGEAEDCDYNVDAAHDIYNYEAKAIRAHLLTPGYREQAKV